MIFCGLRRLRVIDNQLPQKLARLDDAAAVLRHISCVRADKLLLAVTIALSPCSETFFSGEDDSQPCNAGLAGSSGSMGEYEEVDSGEASGTDPAACFGAVAQPVLGCPAQIQGGVSGGAFLVATLEAGDSGGSSGDSCGFGEFRGAFSDGVVSEGVLAAVV
jgi:hypothetical protein